MAHVAFADRLRLIAAWMDKRDPGGSREVQTDLRRVAIGLEEDGTLNDLMTDLQENFWPETHKPGVPVIRAREMREFGSLAVEEGDVVHATITVRTEPSSVNLIRHLTPVLAKSGDQITFTYTIKLTP